MAETLPILDISNLHTNVTWATKKEDPCIQQLVSEILKGFQTWGFLYVKGHNIPDDVIKTAFAEAKKFFEESAECKEEFNRGSGISLGYIPPSGELFGNSVLDAKEAFDYLPNSSTSDKLQQKNPSMVKAQNELFKNCHQLVSNLLRLLALALNVDCEHFVKLHSAIGDRDKNGTSMRLLYYPEINTNVCEGQMRCSEHTDYGTLTLLFQDDVGGLEVQSPSGKFVTVTPIPDTIIINGGDLLQTWSGGEFKATLHKVTIPENVKGKPRQSIAFFTHPDYNTNINCSDENGTLIEVNAYEHLKGRFDATIHVD